MSIKRTDAIAKKLSELEGIKIFFTEILEKRQIAFDSKSERWQESDKGIDEQNNLADLTDFVGQLEEQYDNSDNIFEAD